MSEKRFSGPWTPEEVRRNQAVAQERVRRDASRGVSVNVRDGINLTKFANRVYRAFAHARKR